MPARPRRHRPADPDEWTHDPWSGDLAEEMVWGRGAQDMKEQVAAEIAAATSLGPLGLAAAPASCW